MSFSSISFISKDGELLRTNYNIYSTYQRTYYPTVVGRRFTLSLVISVNLLRLNLLPLTAPLSFIVCVLTVNIIQHSRVLKRQVSNEVPPTLRDVKVSRFQFLRYTWRRARQWSVATLVSTWTSLGLRCTRRAPLCGLLLLENLPFAIHLLLPLHELRYVVSQETCSQETC